MLIMENEIT